MEKVCILLWLCGIIESKLSLLTIDVTDLGNSENQLIIFRDISVMSNFVDVIRISLDLLIKLAGIFVGNL